MATVLERFPSTDIRVSLTSFADYLFKTGLAKVNCVKQVRQQYERGYNQSFDYYKTFREAVAGILTQRLPVSELDVMAAAIEPESKRRNYEALVRGFHRFWARNFQEHDWLWVSPAKAEWSHGGVNVRVNPEIAVQQGGYTYHIKLYNKTEPLKKKQLDVVLHLMQLGIQLSDERPVVAVLDVRRGRMFEELGFNPRMTSLLQAEALAFAHLWHDAGTDNPS